MEAEEDEDDEPSADDVPADAPLGHPGATPAEYSDHRLVTEETEIPQKQTIRHIDLSGFDDSTDHFAHLKLADEKEHIEEMNYLDMKELEEEAMEEAKSHRQSTVRSRSNESEQHNEYQALQSDDKATSQIEHP